MKKIRIFAVRLVCLLLVFQNITCTDVFAGEKKNYFTYYGVNEYGRIRLKITGTGELPDCDYCTSCEINNIPQSPMVTHYNSFYLSNMNDAYIIIIEEGITGIGRCNFRYFHDLQEVIIADSVVKIGENAFPKSQVDMHGKTLSVVEAYATENGHNFIPTNEQLRGDVNGNGTYEAEDALGILKMVVRLDTKYGYSADANEDGEVSAEDALKVLRKVVELE